MRLVIGALTAAVISGLLLQSAVAQSCADEDCDNIIAKILGSGANCFVYEEEQCQEGVEDSFYLNGPVADGSCEEDPGDDVNRYRCEWMCSSACGSSFDAFEREATKLWGFDPTNNMGCGFVGDEDKKACEGQGPEEEEIEL